jgi:uncharacterized membrane protein (DUF4010 family)
MYIVVIGWLFVTLIIAISQASVVAAMISFAFWGLLPLSLILWIFGRAERKRRSAKHAGRIADETKGDH